MMSIEQQPLAQTAQLPWRILIIEDEPMLTVDLQETLTEAGFVIVGVAGKLGKALALIENIECDAALVDANLAGVSAGPAAVALTARGVPFVVLSGYSVEQQRGAFAGARSLQKPCRPAPLIAALNAAIANK